MLAAAGVAVAAAGGVAGAREKGGGPTVVVSIAPIHSLAAMAMAGVAEPRLLLPRGASPHGYALKPSDARALSRADLVIWVGPQLESFLVKPFAALVAPENVLALVTAPGVATRPARHGGAWEDEAEAGPAAHPHDHRGHEPGEAGIDPHVWLDPVNGAAMVEAIAAALARLDAGNAGRYRANARRAVRRIKDLGAALGARLATVRPIPYIVFHDAYAYFEARYRLRAVGSVVVGSDRRPGIKRVTEIRARLRRTGAVCVFAEPQFSPAIAATVVEGTGARIGVLDPLGVGLAPGPDLYGSLLTRLATSLVGCLSGPSARPAP
jgi:zinc transport system substrate-binding protein